MKYDHDLFVATVEEESIAAVANRVQVSKSWIANLVKGIPAPANIAEALAAEFPYARVAPTVLPDTIARDVACRKAARERWAATKAARAKRDRQMERELHYKLIVGSCKRWERVRSARARADERHAPREAALAQFRRSALDDLGIKTTGQLAKAAECPWAAARDFLAGKIVRNKPGMLLRAFWQNVEFQLGLETKDTTHLEASFAPKPKLPKSPKPRKKWSHPWKLRAKERLADMRERRKRQTLANPQQPL